MSGSLATNLDANGDGLTALDYRKILQGFYPNPGIVKGGTVTGNSSLTYHVAPTVAVIDRGSDGTRLVYFSGGDTPAVAAGDASNRRIDVIWMKANDPALDGGSKEVTIGVTQGTPSANPVVPQLDSGKLSLMEKLVQPGATNLSTGSGDNRSYNYAIPYGASMGVMNRYVYTGAAPSKQTTLTTVGRKKILLPTDRNLHFWAKFSLSTSGSSGSEGGLWGYFRVDGVAVTRWQAAYSNQRWDNLEFTWDEPVQQGIHTVDLQYAITKTSPKFSFNSADSMKPITFTVTDMGVAK